MEYGENRQGKMAAVGQGVVVISVAAHGIYGDLPKIADGRPGSEILEVRSPRLSPV